MKVNMFTSEQPHMSAIFHVLTAKVEEYSMKQLNKIAMSVYIYIYIYIYMERRKEQNKQEIVGVYLVKLRS